MSLGCPSQDSQGVDVAIAPKPNSPTRAEYRVRVLAVASEGGHWEELIQLRSAFEGADVTFVSTSHGYADRDHVEKLKVIVEANRHSGWAICRLFLQAWRLVRSEKPDAVISTGAMPGLACLLAGRLQGARTMWIDSIANSERLSASGRLARVFAHETLTQWPHLARPGSVGFAGAIL